MKKRFLIINTFMGLAVLFAILFQSFDAMGHLEKQFSKKHCHHYSSHKHTSELTHSHDGLEKCFACEFVFSNSVVPANEITIGESTEVFYKPFFFSNPVAIPFFNGSSFFLRGPPA